MLLDKPLFIRVIPRSSRNLIKIEPSGQVRVYVTTPPVDGEANQAVIELLAKGLGVAKSSVTIVSGETSKDKGVQFNTLGIEEALKRLQSRFGNFPLPGL